MYPIELLLFWKFRLQFCIAVECFSFKLVRDIYQQYGLSCLITFKLIISCGMFINFALVLALYLNVL